MQLTVSLVIFVVAVTCTMMQETSDTPEAMVLKEQIGLLKAKVVRLRNLVGPIISLLSYFEF